MDNRKNNGGHSTKGVAGRKPKADEQKLIERLSPMDNEALTQLSKAIKEGQQWAVKLFMSYRWGMPKQDVTVTEINSPFKPIDLDAPEDDSSE